MPKKPNQTDLNPFYTGGQAMSPEEEWEYEEKLEQLSYRLEELVLDVFIAVVEKLKDRNQIFLQPNPQNDEMKF
jgi:predicted RNA-binding protein